MNDIITATEFTAFQILGSAGLVGGFNTTQPEGIHSVANRFIELAERIKAERAVVSMQR